MTYPQQPYGQQPDPYGQGQQPGQYGGGYQTPQGGYPQTGGQPQQGYPGYDPTAQYPNPQYQNPQYGGFPGGQYGGYGPPPPPKKNTGVIVAVIAIVVLLLGGLGITGFVAPGFFLSDDKNTAGGGGGDDDSGADAFIDKLVKAADGKDKSALRGMSCKDAEDNVTQAITDIDDIDGATLKKTNNDSASKATAVLDITFDGSSHEFNAVVVRDSSDWCWKDIAASSGGGGLPAPPSSTSSPDETGIATGEPPPSGGSGGGGGGGSAEGQTFVQGFLDALNGGDAASAKTKLCPDSTSQGDVDDAVTGKANLQMDTSGMEAQDQYIGVDLKGTLKGAPTSAARTSAFLEDGGWCIFTFYAF
ncbi:MAG TPA: hypothetical protein VGP26_05155 [Actinophytocola sp.]|jgi:hypothetical protein|nr:hypothetical protein [Actinophytocola sp.]